MSLTFVNQVGAIEGLNQAAPGTLIPESFVRWAQDVLFDRAGLMRRRGPFSTVETYKQDNLGALALSFPDPTDFDASWGHYNERVIGVFSTYDPNGSPRIGVVSNVYSGLTTQTATVYEGTYMRFYDEEFVAKGWKEIVKVEDYPIVSAVPALGGGVWLSFANDPNNPSLQAQYLWRGGCGCGATGDTVKTGVNITGERTLTIPVGQTVANVTPGQFAFIEPDPISNPGDYYYLGVVKNVNVPGRIVELEKDAFIWDTSLTTPNQTNLTVRFSALRPFIPAHGRGLLTVNSGSTTVTSGNIGTSAEGHWASRKINNTWMVYRASDHKFIGRVNSSITNTGLTLAANSPITMSADEYIMRNVASVDLSGTTTDKALVSAAANTKETFAGLYTAVYAGYQWYGNFSKNDEEVNRVVFSAAHDKEAVDLSPDAADSIVFPGKSQFRGMASSSSGLLVFLEDKTYILRGNDRSNFSVEQLVPDGCISPSSIVEYGGGVFWAAKRGLMFFDGASVRNLTRNNLGMYYTDSVKRFDPVIDRVYGFIHKDNLVMNFTRWESPFKPVKYEPLYAADWNNTPAISDRQWTDFDPDYDFDDFFTKNNTPIYWDKQTLNDPGSAGNLGRRARWYSGEVPLGASDLVLNTIANTNDASIILDNDPTGLSRVKLIATHATDPLQSYSEVVRVTGVSGSGPYTTSISPNLINTYDPADPNYTIEVFEYAINPIINNFSQTIDYPVDLLWDTTNLYKWGPLRTQGSLVLSVYLPTSAVTTLSNFEYTGFTSTETIYGLSSIASVNSVENIGTTSAPVYADRVKLVDINNMFDLNSNGDDPLLVKRLNVRREDLVKGPDFYIQTKHFTVGDPILRKWFQRVLLSMLLYDGAIRMDILDDDDNDEVDINKKKPRNWAIFTENGYDWDYLGKGEGNDFGIVFPKLTSPDRSNWQNVEGTQTEWLDLFVTDFNRYSKRISWRKSSAGFRLYQLNNYKKPFENEVTKPYRLELQGFSIGFKPLRAGRI